MNKNILLVVKFIIVAALFLLVDNFILLNSYQIHGYILTELNEYFSYESLYNSDLFANTIFRYFLSIACISFFVTSVLLLKINIIKFTSFFKPTLFSSSILILVFIFLNSKTNNNSELMYATISYCSLVLTLFRENLIFSASCLFTKDRKTLYALSLISLILFIALHPIELTIGRITTTIFMITVWIYTTATKNIWLGVAMHVAWNLVLTDSIAYHLLLLSISCLFVLRIKSFPEEMHIPFLKRLIGLIKIAKFKQLLKL